MTRTAGPKPVDNHTVKDVIDNIMDNWKLEKWFSWPPDVFLMTSYLLKKTGAYRDVVNEHDWKFQEIQRLRPLGEQWLASIQKTLTSKSTALELPKEIQAMVNELEDISAQVKFTELRSLGTADSKRLSFLLIKIHALADTACVAFGILGDKSKHIAVVHFLANLLLITRGSLSTIPKFQGIVVPKMRTPQSGLTIRSFSLHVAYHDTEVEVMWRAIPWLNVDQNHLNILCVPWPTRVNTAEFKCKDETFESVRYFGYHNELDERNHIHGLIDQIVKINTERGRIHLVVLPAV